MAQLLENEFLSNEYIKIIPFINNILDIFKITLKYVCLWMIWDKKMVKDRGYMHITEGFTHSSISMTDITNQSQHLSLLRLGAP